MADSKEIQSTPGVASVPFGSNAIRLTGRQWAAAGFLTILVLLSLPAIWRHFEPFTPGPDYRIPYELSNDYWMYARYGDWAAEQSQTLVLGDSVIWGEYVTPDTTLSHHLNQQAEHEQFINLGVNGTHPVVMAGLLRYYGGALRGRRIILQYNPLWMSSPERDLQSGKETRFNHPKLAPQFRVDIPCYRASYPERIGIVIERYLPFRGWANHLSVCYFDNNAVAAWAMEHPYANPFRQITFELPTPSNALRHDPVSWAQSGIPQVKFAWVDAASSLQWRFFRETVDLLRRRGNHVFIVVGPFNEHMIHPESKAPYEAVKASIEEWLRAQKLPCLMAPVLPSELYADASHPLSEGYARLAGQILASPAYQGMAAS